MAKLQNKTSQLKIRRKLQAHERLLTFFWRRRYYVLNHLVEVLFRTIPPEDLKSCQNVQNISLRPGLEIYERVGKMKNYSIFFRM